jgi:GNAT superfamily N-acetyltransferase
VRRATEADAARIAALLAAAFAEYEPFYTPAAFRAATPGTATILGRLREGPIWIAESLDGRAAGTLSGVASEDELFLRSLAVPPHARGDGGAAALLAAAEKFALDAHCRRIRLSMAAFLDAATRFYESRGFVRTPDGPHDFFGTPIFSLVKRLSDVVRGSRSDCAE